MRFARKFVMPLQASCAKLKRRHVDIPLDVAPELHGQSLARTVAK
jgi:hypothetical protein